MPIDGTLSFTTPPPALPSSLSPSLPPPLPPGQPYGKHSSHLIRIGADVKCMQNNFGGHGLKDFAPFQICPFPLSQCFISQQKFHNNFYTNLLIFLQMNQRMMLPKGLKMHTVTWPSPLLPAETTPPTTPPQPPRRYLRRRESLYSTITRFWKKTRQSWRPRRPRPLRKESTSW